MSGSTLKKLLIVLGTAGATTVVAGVAGLLMACYPSALQPMNFHEYGHCFATDTPKEVFGSFAIMGLIVIGPVLAIFFASRLAKKRDHTE